MRVAHFSALVVALVIGGGAWFWYSHSSSEATTEALEQILTGPTGQAGKVAAIARAQVAASAMEILAARSGTYSGATTAALLSIDPTLDPSVKVVSATEQGYCVQASLGDAVAHASGPGGLPQTGPCPA